MVGTPGEDLTHLVSLRLVDFQPLPRLVGRGGHLVGLIHDHQVPLARAQGGTNVVLLDEVHRRDGLRELLPHVFTPRRPHDVPIHKAEVYTKLLLHLPLPLVLQMTGGHDQHSAHQPSSLHFLEEQTRHDRLAGTRVVGDQETEMRLLQGVVIHGLDLMREWIHLRDAHGEHRVELVRQPDSIRLDQEEELLRVPAQRLGRALGDGDLGHLRGGEPQGAVLSGPVQGYLEEVVTAARLKLLDAGGAREEGSSDDFAIAKQSRPPRIKRQGDYSLDLVTLT